MSNLDLGFLGNLELETPETKPKQTTSSTPINGSMRIRKSGKVDFSDEFTAIVGKAWLDLFFSHKWLQYPKESQPNILFVCVNKEEKPAKADIKGAGTSVFVKEQFWAQAVEVFGLDEETTFIDLQMEEEELPVPIAMLPKTVQRGVLKGTDTWVKRENIVLNVLTPNIVEVTEEESKDPTGTSEEEAEEEVQMEDELVQGEIDQESEGTDVFEDED